MSTDTIDQTAFARLVQIHCRLSGFDPDLDELADWLRTVWPHVTDNMDPARWARAYLLSIGLANEARRKQSAR